MPITKADGLTADWVNAWLAAIGVCHLCPGVELRWTSDPQPVAEFRHDRVEGPRELAELIAGNLPDREDLEHMAIARNHPDDDHEFKQNPSLEAYRARAGIARRIEDFTISSTVTDLGALAVLEKKGKLARSPFNPPAPGTRSALWDRMSTCHERISAGPRAAIEASLIGRSDRTQTNGLGFDYLRIFSPTVPDGEVMVDPTVELLAFFGLALFPIRGDGIRDHTRGWTGGVLSEGSFTWAVWEPWLDVTGIDALLDIFYAPGGPRRIERHLVARFASVPFRPKSPAEATRGIASKRLD